MKIVFHGTNASVFRPEIELSLAEAHEIEVLSDALEGRAEASAFREAEVIVGIRLARGHPVGPRLRLYHVPGAGYDAIDTAALPDGAALCNCFGHEAAIAEYVMAALLSRHVPLADADTRLRRGDWRYWAGGPSGLRTELGSESIGIIGFGHIGKAVAARAAAFGMAVHVANRSPVADALKLAGAYGLDRLRQMMAAVDVVVNTLPLTDTTRGLIGAGELAAMRKNGVIINVGRGGVIDEDALFEALSGNTIGGAIIDTWYVYPGPGDPNPLPATRPFHELDNVVMTPHMSGWTFGTIARRRRAIAENVNRLASGAELLNRIL
jgi:phosphoglycerate dehydrogenase-like enzyme